MTDIYDIKENILWLPFSILLSLIFSLLIVWTYFLVNYLKDKKKVIIKKEILIEEKKQEINYIEILKDIENSISKIKTSDFYKDISELLRMFLENEKNIINITKKSFKEIKELNLEKDLENLIKEIYFNEYCENESNFKKQEIIEKIKKIF